MDIADFTDSIFKLIVEHPNGNLTQSGSGSIWVYKKSLYLLTAKHCLMPGTTQAGMQVPQIDNVVKKVHLFDQAVRVVHSEAVMDQSDGRVLFKTWMVDEEHALDIALLPLTDAPDELWHLAFDESILDDNYIPQSGDPIHLAGFAYDKEDTVTTLMTNVIGPEDQPLPGEIAQWYFLFDSLGSNLKGVSGTPIFDSYSDRVVGIAVGQHQKHPLGYAHFAKFILSALRRFD